MSHLATESGCLRHRLTLAVCLATGLLCVWHEPASAQVGQLPPPAGSNQNAATLQGRQAPAPWRPSFGPISRQDQQAGVPGSIPARQPTQNANGQLPLPNSPAGGINLQTGTNKQFGTINNGSGSTANPVRGNPTGTLPPPNSTQRPGNQSNVGQRAAPIVGSNSLPAQNSNGFTNPQNQIDQRAGRRSITRVTKSMSKLPNDAGQVWREYDITPYTSRVTGVTDPQQAILDWILKETGTEMWFNQPLGILNADRNQLRVYHTPEIQQIVNQIVDRFVNTRGQVQNLEVSLITIGRPNWRSAAYPVLQPIEVQSPGVEAWMVSKENAALLRSTLARRADFRDHGTGRIGHNDGQTVVLRNTKPVQFIRNFRWVPNQVPSYQPLVTNVDEGYTLEISSLSSLDGDTIEASIQCHVDQVEKFTTVNVDVPGTPGASSNRLGLQIPQIVSWRLKERFRWQNDQVLLLSCGVVATPEPQQSLPINLPGILGLERQRADALLFLDYRGPELRNNLPNDTVDLRTVPVNQRR